MPSQYYLYMTPFYLPAIYLNCSIFVYKEFMKGKLFTD